MSVYMHSLTSQAVERVQRSLTNAVLLQGDEGAGKFYLAQHIAETLLENKPVVGSSLHLIEPDSEKNFISIDDVRHIKDILKLKVPGTSQRIKRVIIVRDAHLMLDSAQNAFLKTLEEPPDDTVLLLTATTKDELLPTVLSRLTAITVHPLSLPDAKQAFVSEDIAALEKAYYLSNGNAGLLHALLAGGDHSLVDAMQTAKELLSATAFERLCAVDELVKDKKNKQVLGDVLYCLKRIAKYMVHTEATPRNIHRLRAIVEAEQDLRLRVNAKLLFTDLFIKL